jgi:predicted Zn-dependent protease
MTIPVSGFRFQVSAAAMAAAAAVLLAGCATVSQTVATIGTGAGIITPEQGQSIVKTGEAFGKALEQITPEQEYYVGRAVGATVVSTYKVYDDPAATRYVNLVGQTLAQVSDKPETFGGYHFLILDSPDINAFAAPGGLIFVSRGMLRLCKNEDQLAAVLAHEVAHVNLGHAISAISNSRWTQAFTILGTEGAKSFGGEQLAQLTAAFEGSINDITKTLMTSGYARKQEKQADAVAIKIMQRVGYNPRALVQVLGNMEKNLKPGGHDFAATHPPPGARVADLNAAIGQTAAGTAPAARAQRFANALGNI